MQQLSWSGGHNLSVPSNYDLTTTRASLKFFDETRRTHRRTLCHQRLVNAANLYRRLSMKRYALFYAALFASAVALGYQHPVHAEAKAGIYLSGKKQFGADLAVGGYDAVAYQTAAAPVAGKKEFSTEWQGATWQFSSAENLELFKASPEKYAPQYGGYCAYGVAQGAAVHGDPQQWTVRDGKLYLNYDASVQKTWKKDEAGFISTADKQWPAVLGK
jgi:YHS domain-containing protein